MIWVLITLWYTSGVVAAIYAWTLGYDFTTRDIPEILLAGLAGPIFAYWIALPSIARMRITWYKEYRPDHVWNPNPYNRNVIIHWQRGGE